MKKLTFVIATIFISMNVFAKMNQLKEYIPIAEKLNAGATAEALAEADRISRSNHIASALLYLIYSRGYCGAKVDYTRAAVYFDRLIGTRFHNEEMKNVWGEMLPPPANGQSTVSLKMWNQQGRIIDQKIRLKGRYPLKECYREKMQCIGGPAGYALLAVYPYQHPDDADFENAARKAAIKLGNAASMLGAKYADYKKPDGFLGYPQWLPDTEKAANLGYIPAKIRLAAMHISVDQGFKYDAAKAEKLLKEAVAELKKYKHCKHAARELKNVRYLLSFYPAANISTAELIRICEAGKGDPRKIRIYKYAIGKRDDHPMCEVYRNTDNYEGMKNAAAKGNIKAIELLLTRAYHRNDYWFILYLAGKHKVSEKYSRMPGRSYYFQSLVALDRYQAFAKPEDYRKALKTLAGVYPEAEKKYRMIFGTEADRDPRRYRVTASNPEKIKISRENAESGSAVYTLDIQQDSQHNYVDIFITPGRFNLYCNTVPSAGANEIWTKLLYPDGKTHIVYGGHIGGFGLSNKCPVRMRINIEAGNKKFKMTVRL